MNDIPMRWTPVKYMHTGKHDYDDGFKCINIPSNNRSMKRYKTKRKRLLDKLSYCTD